MSVRSSRSSPSYLLEHARRHDYALLTRPEVHLEADERLRLGEFGIQTRLVKPPARQGEAPEQGEQGHTMVYSVPPKDTKSRKRRPAAHLTETKAIVSLDDRRYVLDGPTATLGRSRECDCVLNDPNVSRKHAELRRGSTGDWQIVDLGSTNGVKVNGRQVDASRLGPGDEVVLGTVRFIFDIEQYVDTEPIAVALKFGFLAVLYLFLFWVSRSALRELRRTSAPAPEATGFHPIGPGGRSAATDASLVAVTGGGLTPNERYDLFGGLSIGRSRRGRRPHRRPLRVLDPLPPLLARRRVLRRGHELDQRHLPQRGPAAGRGRALRPRRGQDRRHRVPLRARRCPEAADAAAGHRAGVPFRHRAPAGGERGLVLRPGARCSRWPTGWAGRRPARSPRGSRPTRSSPPCAGTNRRRRTCARSPRTPTSGSTALAQRDSSRSGMGTTLTAALVEGDEVSLAHVGDSRAYLWRDGALRMLTSDHSLVEELRRQGRISDEQAEDHPQRSIITRALGPEAEVEVDTLTFSARPGDVFVLCSDGLTTMIKDDEIARIIGRSESLDEAVRALVEAANEAGGRDNITVVAFRLEDADGCRRRRGRTLIGPSAEDAGLTADRVREAAERQRRGRELVAAQRPSRWRTAAKVLWWR